MRCPDCNKFVGMENGDPEVEAFEISYNGDKEFNITAEVRLTRNCADCGTELKDRTAYLDSTLNLSEFTKDGNGDTISAEEVELIHTALDTLQTEEEIEDCGDADVSESGGGRYAKNMITLTMSGVVSITVGELTYKACIELTDSASASEYDECC